MNDFPFDLIVCIGQVALQCAISIRLFCFAEEPCLKSLVLNTRPGASIGCVCSSTSIPMFSPQRSARRLIGRPKRQSCGSLRSSTDEHAEYRDQSFLDRLEVNPTRVPLIRFWPSRRPRWDGLGRTGKPGALLVEMKADVEETNTSSSRASSRPLALIHQSLNQWKFYIRSSSPHDWASLFSQ